MPDPVVYTVSKITASNGTTYEIRDLDAQAKIEALGSPTHYIGELSSSDTHYSSFVDGCEYNPVLLVKGTGTESHTAVSGDILSKTSLEFIFDGTSWHSFGDLSEYGDFAKANKGTVTIKPKGTCPSSAVTFATSGNTAEAITALGNAKCPSHGITVGTGDKVTVITALGTGTAAAQTVTVGTNDKVTAWTGVSSATTPKPSGTTKYMKATATGTATSNSNLVTATASHKTGNGSTGSLPTFSSQVDANGVLSFTFGQGSLPTMPTFEDVTVATGSLAANGTGDSVATGISTQPTVALASESSTATGRCAYISAVSTSGTQAVTITPTTDIVLGEATTFENSTSSVSFADHSTDVVLGEATTFTDPETSITFGTHTKATVLKSTVTASTASKTFQGTEETYEVLPVMPTT